jgi:hypothetical protein
MSVTRSNRNLEYQMGEDIRRKRERNAGAFMGPDIMVPVPMRTLSDDYEDRPTDPPDDAAPAPERPGRMSRLLGGIGDAARGLRRRR